MANRTETHCIYTYKHGYTKGIRCDGDIMHNGYCNNHQEYAKGSPFRTKCMGMRFNSFNNWRHPGGGSWYSCQEEALIDGYCSSCLTDPVNKQELQTRCQNIITHQDNYTQRCRNEAQQNGYCLHCIYNKIHEPHNIVSMKDRPRIGNQPLITNFFKPKEQSQEVTNLIDAMQGIQIKNEVNNLKPQPQ